MASPSSHSQKALPQPDILTLDRIEKQEEQFRIFVSTRQSAFCPVCGMQSRSQHSGYSRRLADVAWQGCSVQLWLSLHKWRCREQNCPRKVFCERIVGVARTYARRTERLATVVGAVGYVAGGLPGARLLERLAISISDDSVRRQVIGNATRLEQQEPIRHLGIDDWAWRKYQTYGTLLVDLDRHKVVDLLADRAADSVAEWLKKHSTVEIVTRDRSGSYADGATSGAPQALQVADRFHLILNLSAAIERVREERSRELILPPVTPETQAKPTLPVSSKVEKPTPTQELTQQRRQRRLDRYEQVTKLRQQGYSNMAISRELSLSVKTVRRLLRADQFPERKPPSGRRKKVAEYAAYLDERWKEGCHNSTQLLAEIRKRGYKGSRQMVTSYVCSWRHNPVRKNALALCRQSLGVAVPEPLPPVPLSLLERFEALTGRSLLQCPVCKTPTMVLVEQFPPAYPFPFEDST